MTSSAAYSIWTMKMMCYLASNVTTVLLHHATFKKGHDEDDVLILASNVVCTQQQSLFYTPCHLYHNIVLDDG